MKRLLVRIAVYVGLPAIGGAISLRSWGLALGGAIVAFYSYLFYWLGYGDAEKGASTRTVGRRSGGRHG